MAIELRLENSGGGPWGFKLTGGADLEIPLTVVKISDGGPAHKAGLQIGDVILKVNESDLADLPHSEAQDAIGNSGEVLILIIYRGELTEHQSALLAEERNNEEVYQIMEGSIPIDYPERPYIEEQTKETPQQPEIQHDLNLTDEEIRSIINPELSETITSASHIEQQSSTQIEIQQHQKSHAEVKYEAIERKTIQVECQKVQKEECIDSIRQNSVIGESELLAKHEEIENIAGKIVEQMSKIQQKQEEEIKNITEEVSQIAEMNEEAVIWQSQVKVEQKVLEEEVQNVTEKIVEEVSHSTEINQESAMYQSHVQQIEQMTKDVEVKNVTEKFVEDVSHSAKQTQEAVVWQSQVMVEQKQLVQQSEVLKAVSGYLSEMEMERRKWSTFLQKPKCPKPVSKFIQEPEKSTYKVVIRTKKDLEEAKKAAEEAAIREAEDAARAIEEAARAAEAAARAEEEAARAAEETERIAFEEAEARLQAEYDMEQREIDDNENILESENIEDDDDRSRSEATSKHMSGKDAVVTVEQQLAQVKEQLLALSELPSTIQMTLSIITEQLQKLAQEAQPLTEDDFRDDELSNADNTETEDEVTELLVLESQEALSVVDEESENIRVDFSLEGEVMEEEIIDTTKEEEEAEARRLEEARIAKKEKEKMQQQPLTPLERPIILPGGRKWSQPDDAVRSVRQPKLSDDKIDETISSYYEVITGKTIGINFLKYQPPPKNLDHLQNSEVYKMVHDLEPPPRGITARAEKIPAVQDYLVKTNGEEDKLPAQMER